MVIGFQVKALRIRKDKRKTWQPTVDIYSQENA